MQAVKQLSVPLVNHPGRLAAVLTALNKDKVMIRAFTVMATGGRGTLRVVPDEPAAATRCLEMLNVKFELADVLLVDVPSRSGGLPRICQRLAGEHLSIDNAYGSMANGRAKSAALAVIKVNDLAKAHRVLSEPASAGDARPRKRPRRRPTPAR